MNKPELFLCSCAGEGVSVEKSEKNLVYLSLWCRGQRPAMNLLNRIKYCFHVLKTGYAWNDEIVLTDEAARMLARYLLSITEIETTGNQDDLYWKTCGNCTNFIKPSDTLCPVCGAIQLD